MPVDASIYFRQQTPDIMGNIQQGLKMRDLMDQRALKRQELQKQQAVEDAYRNNMSTGEDGSLKFDRGATLSSLAKADPMAAMKQQQTFKTQDINDQLQKLEMAKKKTDTTAQILGSVGDQQSWNRARQQAIELGLASPEELPMQYDPGLVRSMQMQTLSVKDRLDQEWKQKEFGLERQKVGIKRQKAQRAAQPKAPKGYRWVYDEKGQRVGQEAIPGGPAWQDVQKAKREQQEAKEMEKQRDESTKDQAKRVYQDINRILDFTDRGDGVGSIEGMFTWLPGTDAKQLNQLLQGVTSNIGFDKLQSMRDMSPTGGALGQVSEREIDLLQATAGTLDPSMSKPMFRDNLKRVGNMYLDIIHGKGNGPKRFELSFDEEGNPISESARSQEDLLTKDPNEMSDEELDRFLGL